eukprot:EG_transcript_35958
MSHVTLCVSSCTVLFRFAKRQVGGHTLNNVGKALIGGLGGKFIDIFEKGYIFLHAKWQASRRRRWFAFPRSENKEISIPPKYISTRWTIWRDCAEWWIEYVDLFKRFVNDDSGLLHHSFHLHGK